MLKKVLAGLCAVTMLFGTATGLPAEVFELLEPIHASAETYGDYLCTVFDNGTLEISRYNGEATELAIPSVIDNKTVVGIGDSAFSYCTDLTSISVPDSVTSIGNYAFSYCGIESISLPSTVTSISYGAFCACTHLTEITIPEGVTSIGGYAFVDCYALKSVSLPDSLLSIGEQAFVNCSVLTELALPDDLTSIGAGAFRNCNRLEALFVPKSVTEIGEYALGYVEGEVDYTPSRHFKLLCCKDTAGHKYAKDNGLDYELIDGEESDASGFTVSALDDGTLEITKYTGSSLAVYIPSEIDGKKVTSIGEQAFMYNEDVKRIVVPDGVASIGDSAFDDCTFLEELVLPDSVASIGDYAFSGCEKLTDITLPRSIKSLGHGLFSGCRNLSSITVPDSVTSIDSFAFHGCNNLTEVILPAGLTSVGDYAFRDCPSLKSITVPKKTVNIGEYAFGFTFEVEDDMHRKVEGFKLICCKNSAGEKYAKDKGLDYELIEGEEEPVIEFAVFDDGTAEVKKYNGTESEVTVPSEIDGHPVTRIGEYAFSNGKSEKNEVLKSVVLPDTIIVIEEGAFSNCTALSSLALPEGLKEIGKYAFGGCALLNKKITVPQSVDTIDPDLFLTPNSNPSTGGGAAKRASLTYGYRCYEGSYANKFAALCGLWFELIDTRTNEYLYYIDDGKIALVEYTGTEENITVPLEIGGMPVDKTLRGFHMCENIKSVTIPEGFTAIDAWAFCYCTSLESITVPEGVTSIGSMAFYGCDKLNSITLPDSTASIGYNAFFGCRNLSCVTVPKNVTNIGEKAFGYYYDEDRNEQKVTVFKIRCYENTTAHKYAKDNGFDFELIASGSEPGDADGNGVCNMQDYGLLQRWLANWGVVINEEACDLNHDGVVNMQDYGLMQRMLAGWDIG